jgi:tetratricopeptide (TPR) repeat protein
LGYRLDRGGTAGSDFIPFQTSAGQLLVQARKTFARKDDLILFSQIFGLTEELRAGGRLKFDLFKRDVPFLTRTKGLAEYAGVPEIIEIFPLRDFAPDYYKLRLALLDRDGREVFAQDEEFEVTALPDIPRPLVVSKVMPASGAGEYDYDMGVQLLNLKRGKDALVYLEKAYARNPNELKYALGLSQCLYIEGQYRRVLDILSPWKGEKATDRVLYFDGKSAHSLGLLEDAIADYTDYLNRFGLNLEILNLLGNAHYQNGDAAEALRAWKKSLEVNPNQENVKKLVQSIEEKNKR